MRRALSALATVASILASASDAGAHARLVTSSPRAGSRLAASPPAIELWFDEVLDAGFHEVTVVSAGAPSTGAASRAPAAISTATRFPAGSPGSGNAARLTRASPTAAFSPEW